MAHMFQSNGEVAQRFEHRRGLLKMSPRQIQDKAGISSAQIFSIRHGEVMGMKVWDRIAAALGTPSEWLLWGTGPEEIEYQEEINKVMEEVIEKEDIENNDTTDIPMDVCGIEQLKERLLEEADNQKPEIIKVVEVWLIKQNGFEADVIFGVAGLERVEMSGLRVEGAVTADKLLFLGKVGQEIQRMRG